MAPEASSSASHPAPLASINPHDVDAASTPPPHPLEPAPTVHQVLLQERVVASAQHIAARLLTIAESFLFLRDGSRPLDPLTWELDLCSATFYATYALCVDPTSIRSRRLLAKCARLGGFNVVLPFSPSGTAASATVTASRINSTDTNDRAGAQAAIHILQKGPAGTFTDAGCAREYREACHVLGRSSDASQAVGIIATSTALGKRKEEHADTEPLQPPQLVSVESRYESQVKTDLAFEAARCHRTDEAVAGFREALEKDCWNWRALTGLCDLGQGEVVGSALAAQHVISQYAEQSQALLPTAVTGSPLCDGEESAMETVSVTSSRPKAGEDVSSKKAKVSDDTASHLAEESSTAPRASSVPRLIRGTASSTHATKTPANGEARRANGQTLDDGVRPTSQLISRALSNARTITNQQLVASQVEPDDKSAVKRGVSKGRVTRATASVSAIRSTGMQLRSGSIRANVNSRPSTRSTAPSQASSVASAASASTSRSNHSTVSTKSGLYGRRTPATSQGTSTDSMSGKSTVLQRNGATNAASSRPALPASRSTAASRWAVHSNGGKTGRIPASAAMRRAAAAEEAAQREAAKIRAEMAERQRAAALETARELAKWLAADLAILGLVRRLGEAYGHVRKFDGESAVTALSSELAEAASEFESAKPIPGAGKRSEAAIVTVMEPLTACWRNTVIYQCLLGRAYNEMAQYARAEIHFEHARKMDPYLLAHMDVYSLVLFQLNREVALAGFAQELTLIEPKAAATQIVIGNAFALQRENQTALVCFQRAAAMAPDYAYAYTLAGHEAHDLGNHDQAIAYFRSAIRCDRRHWNAWAGLGRVFLGMGGHELPACKSLQQAISINPKNHVLWDLVGWTFAQLGQKRNALEAYDRAIALAPRLAVLTYLRRSELLANEGRDEAAHADLLRAFDLAPEEATIHLLLAQSYMRLGDGGFCELEDGGSGAGAGVRGAGAIKASGQMRMPERYQAEITHHLAVAIDLDPSLLKVVKALGEGWRMNASNRIAMNPADLSASGYEEGYMDYSDMSGEVLEDVQGYEDGEDEGDEHGMGMGSYYQQ